MHVLFVGNEDMLAESAFDTLLRAGYLPDWVSDVGEAEVLLQSEAYAIVLFDLDGTGADGLGLLERYRASGGRSPIMVITAWDAVDSRIVALDLGANDYLIKPFDLNEFTARVGVLMRQGTR